MYRRGSFFRSQALQNVHGEKTAARTDFENVIFPQLLCNLPDLPRQASCEQRTQFRGSNKITSSAQFVQARRVITQAGLVQRHLHESGEGDLAPVTDFITNDRAECFTQSFEVIGGFG